jgi:hypothetical protein
MRLLADFGEVVPLVIGVIALISWVANKIKESGNANAAGMAVDPDEVAEGNVRVQAEIDRFLQEVRGGGQPAPKPEVAPPVAEPAAPKKWQRLSERHSISDRHINSRIDGAGLDGDFDGDSDERMSQHVDDDLGHGVAQSVASHMGPSVGTDAGSGISYDASEWTAENVVGLLTSPNGIRQAMLVHEILSRPKGRRGRSGL